MEWNKPYFLSRIKNSQGGDEVFYSITTPSLKSGVLTFKAWFWHTLAAMQASCLFSLGLCFLIDGVEKR